MLAVLCLLLLWDKVNPGRGSELVLISFAVFAAILIFSLKRKRRAIAPEEYVTALEMSHPEMGTSAFALKSAHGEDFIPPEWEKALATSTSELKSFAWLKLRNRCISLLVPLAFIVAIHIFDPGRLLGIGLQFQAISAQLRSGAVLVVLEGSDEGKDGREIALSSGAIKTIRVLSENMILIRMIIARDEPTPIVELRKVTKDGKGSASEGELFQSFQTVPAGDMRTELSGVNEVAVRFAVSRDVALFIPTLSSKPLAEFAVKKLPVPTVELEVAADLEKEDPWPDDKPLPLMIHVESENPLQQVRLLILSGGRQSQEVVANILADDKFDLTSEYSLVLETYVESDQAEVEIVAEAADRSLPRALVGRSAPLKLRTASAYGRYRETLSTLRELKGVLDQGTSQGHSPDQAKSRELMKKALEQSEDSPFFDGIDRMQLQQFRSNVEDMGNRGGASVAMRLSTDLDNFLFEHEMLDDKERDRDFFVAVRGLSRLIEESKNRPVPVPQVTQRIRKFLDDRTERWKLRVHRLPQELKPKRWPKIEKERPFHAAMDQVDKNDQKGTRESDTQSLTLLSKTVVTYLEWIEELEEQENKMRDAAEKERQEGLASAQNQLREMQKRQAGISQKLDRAGPENKERMKDDWPVMRMEQNANIQATQQLEGQLRSLSPHAGERIKFAQEAMELALKSGGEENFPAAESASDLAGRMLREAENAAQQSQRNRSRGRRRHISGDGYYGQSIVGGDVEIRREYQVDKRYREDILEDVRESLSRSSEENNIEDRSVLENYLRSVVR